jgi:DnaJ-class molecular chaperone
MIRKTFYDTLQVSRHALPWVIRAAYKALSQKHHPDKHPDDLETAHKNMKRLNEAYDVLSDPVRKAAYDEHVAALIAESMQGATRPPLPRPHPLRLRGLLLPLRPHLRQRTRSPRMEAAHP